ncbi:Zinc-uptake complex component A periplasmic [uncultured archaeon]|nr:Zinc-uptake complex component A periplasmic [uncultured archaeon]
MDGKKPAVLLLFIVFSAGCLNGTTQQNSTGKIDVVATIFSLYDMAKNIGDEYADVTLLVPPGSETHSYEPTPQKAKEIASADIFIINGLGLEPWAYKIVGSAGNVNLLVVDASANITPLIFSGVSGEVSAGSPDPHVFQDPVLAQTQIDAILSAFIEKDPSHAGDYMKNAEKYRMKLEALDASYKKELSSCARRVVLTNHEFLAYPAARYNFTQIYLQGLSPESEIAPRDLEAAVSTARRFNATVILLEKTASPKIAETVASEANIKVEDVSTAHEISAEEFAAGKTYLDILSEDLDALKTALGCKGAT